MKRILIISMEYPPQIGGIATYVHDLAGALDGENVIVLAPGGRDKFSSEGKKKEWDSAQPYNIFRKKFLYPKFIWPRWLRLFFHVRKIVKKYGVEMVFVQHMLPVGYVAVLIKKFNKVPFLLFSHGTDLVAGTKTRWKKSMVVKISHQAEQIIFNSSSLRNRFLAVLPQFEDKSTILYPCPEPKFLERPSSSEIENLRSTYALEGKQILLTISRITDGKGFPHLIEAMPRILAQYPHLVWFIAGGGDKKEEVVKLIQKNNLQNIVRYIGEIPHDDLRKYYYLADLFVLLTHPDNGKEEGLGLVFLEAAATGVPVVAGRSGGVEEAVIHGRTGLVVDTMNKTEVVNAILDLLKNKDKAHTLGAAAKLRIQRDFLWEVQLKQLSRWINN